MWLHGLDIPGLTHYVREDMGSYGFEMWARAGREIGTADAKAGSPLQSLAALRPSVPELHVYAQPEDPGYLAAQRSFGAAHPWFEVSEPGARSHFPLQTSREIAAPSSAVFAAFEDTARLEVPPPDQQLVVRRHAMVRAQHQTLCLGQPVHGLEVTNAARRVPGLQ